ILPSPMKPMRCGGTMRSSLAMFGDHLGGGAETVDRRGHPRIDRRVQENTGNFRRGHAVVECPAGMSFHFVRAPESRQYGQHDDAALAHREPPFATPACTPAVLVEHLLQRAAEIGGVVESGVHVFRAEHLAADRLAARRKLLAGLVGHSIASCAKGVAKGIEDGAVEVCAGPERASTNPPVRLRPVHYSTPKGGRAGGFPHTDGTAGL